MNFVATYTTDTLPFGVPLRPTLVTYDQVDGVWQPIGTLSFDSNATLDQHITDRKLDVVKMVQFELRRFRRNMREVALDAAKKALQKAKVEQ